MKKILREDKLKTVKREDKIIEIINKKPDAHILMVEAGLHCIGCGGAAFESLEQGALAHGMDDKEIDLLIKKINQLR